YLPDEVSAPGATLLDLLAERGMSQAELAARTGRPVKTINEIVKGKAAITPETAIQFERVLGAPASFWNNRESQYRESLARGKERVSLERSAHRLKDVPTRAMEKLGWIAPERDPAKKLEQVLGFFGVASIDALESRAADTRFRQSEAFKASPIAVGAWLRKGHLDADKIRCEPFDERKFRTALMDARRLSAEMPEDFAETLVALCATAGVAVVLVPELPGTHLSGAARWLTPGKALIQLSLRHKSDDHFWFTFFHEAGHILLHGRRRVFIDTDEPAGTDEEREADEFASNALIAPEQWQRFIAAKRYTKAEIRRYAQRVGVSPGIVVGRLQHERRLGFKFCNGLKRRVPFG
ncbi:MAG: ImmA/IrrE family metallo-endopeptidase, partial [Acidobacteria bacterium]|nr:ImmA/IrrE family metallo-endopeptidase [Acidobacteriota bacterium]